jgi:hypothetical protein
MFDVVSNYKITGPFRANEQQPNSVLFGGVLDESHTKSVADPNFPVASGSSLTPMIASVHGK